eukprot:CAMPEP_0116854384 /NCGR_PEP_ID=MMETSP0418-20121206/18562_1 /TAXON_ID=1158023 /ORGANISM="Astrosyne radiata, Strain 13vi08-1A" /LENGTH=272 /DNA_ID=CAMNT_0004487139 /DNA_START=71 /DNA_END=889 /DNA_ORIENTATION=-
MLQNVMNNIPQDWAIQLVVHPEWWESEILKLHRGMKEFLKRHPERIVLTPIPEEYWRLKPKEVLMKRWFWNHLVADRVFMFSGNGVICSHSLARVEHFNGIAFLGVPFARGNGLGGDGSTHSIRDRRVMQVAISLYQKAVKAGEKQVWTGSESLFFTTMLQEINRKLNMTKYRLAERNETILFGGGAQLITKDENNIVIRDEMEQYGPSLVLSGTGAGLDWNVRDALLSICPEWKLIFPSLHDPNCFGATPQAEKCAASICALRPDRPKRGC